jgi:hypothetical protein
LNFFHSTKVGHSIDDDPNYTQPTTNIRDDNDDGDEVDQDGKDNDHDEDHDDDDDDIGGAS